MEQTSYSQASPHDLFEVKAILKECDLPTDDLQPSHLDQFILCRLAKAVVGTVGLEPLGDVALLRSFAVARELRGRGIGRELWARASNRAVAAGIRRIYLLTTTADELFARWGFQYVPRDQVAEVVRNTTEYSTMCPSTATVMAMDLSDQMTALGQPLRPKSG